MIPIDDTLIDTLIWEAICQSPSRGDYICYLVHAPAGAKHREKAKQRLETLNAEDSAPKHYPQAIAAIRKHAETGDAAALFHMGKIHALGIAVRRDPIKAAAWYEKAMAAGEPRAFANLGWFCQSGMGVKKDPAKALELLLAGASGGVISAQAAAGMMLVTGEGCQPDAQKGIALLQEAFEKGYTNAGNHLADLYLAGKHLPKNSEKGHQWLFNVVGKGDHRTAAILGHYLVAGTHGKTDTEKGLALLQTAAENGFLPAWLWLAALYKNGTGVKQDLDTARKWYEKGIAAGSKECEAALAHLLAEHAPGFVSPENPPLQ
ncbi:MAG: sel1 repeat family protein [Oxalobacter formigenes]|nr:sel1 repeat family protein [Oxalobacter formigenes]